jgi:uridine kinase
MIHFEMPCETPRQPERIHDISLLKSKLIDRIRTGLRDSEFSAFFVAVDGLPGTGKSTVVQKLAPALEELDDIQHFPVSVDDFIATDRDSPLRRTMVETEDPEVFWRIFYLRGALEYVLWKTAVSDGEGRTIPLPRKYDRPSGRVLPGTIEITGCRKVVNVEGVNASEKVRCMFTGEGEWPFATVMVEVDPAIALLRAVDRDMEAGRRNGVESYRYRQREYRHMMPRIERNGALADFVYLNGHDRRGLASTPPVAYNPRDGIGLDG